MKSTSLFLLSGLLLTSSLPASASLWDIVCVECSLLDANFSVIDLQSGVITSSPINLPGSTGGDFDAVFFGKDLIAHDVNFYFNPGTYHFDSMGDSITLPQTISMTVNPGQVGLHFLFDWGGNNDIDVLSVFNVSTVGGVTTYAPTDVDGNAVLGFRMVDGPFQGIDASVNFVVATPVPAAAWLFGSGLVGIIGLSARKR